MTKTITELITDAHETATSKGWWEDRDPVEKIPEQIALMHSELSEALEEYRNGNMEHLEPPYTYYQSDGKPEGFGIELADCMIRIFDTCGALGIDLNECLRDKMAYNETRSHRHGGKKC